jgi:hypothetical protein
LDDLIELINLPGKAFRPTVKDKITIPSDAMALAGAYGAPTGLDPNKFPGVVDDTQALLKGKWMKGSGLKPYFHYGYRYSSDPESTATFTLEAPKDGQYDTQIAYQPHPNRGKSVPVEVTSGDKATKLISIVNMTQKPSFENGFHSVGRITLRKGQKVMVRLSAKGSKGNVHVDAGRLVPID